jgi:electron transfer flavoprotein alpha subunit
MGKILIVAEIYHNEFRKSTYHALRAGAILKEKGGGEYDLLLIHSDPGSFVKEVERSGAGKILLARHPSLKEYLAEAWVEVVSKIVQDRGYDTVLMASTTTGKDFLPRLAGRWKCGMVSDIIEVVTPTIFKRPVYAGNAIATVEIRSEKKVLSFRTTAFEKLIEVEGAAPVVEEVEVGDLPPFGGEFLSFSPAVRGERPELTEARIVVSGGRGTKGDFQPIFALADILGAAVGASRAVVDAGWAPNDWQVGQTGKVVAPELYIAVGISGAIQHWAGMKDSKVIVAINKDPEAPIMQLADYALVGDLFQVVPELVEKLKKLKENGEIQV